MKKNVLFLVLTCWFFIAWSIPLCTQSEVTEQMDSIRDLLYQNDSRDSNYVRHLLAIGDAFLPTASDSALTYFLRAASISRQQKYALGEANGLVKAGNIYLTSFDLKPAKEILLRADSICSERGFGALGIKNKIYLGNLFFYLNDNPKALVYVDAARNAAEEINDWKSLGYIFRLNGAIYSSYSDYAKALEAYLAAISAFEKVNFLEGVAGMYTNMGHIYAATNQPLKAIEQFEKSLEGFSTIGNGAGERLCWYNIGNRYVELGRIDDALPFLNQAVAFDQKSGNPIDMAYSFMTLGDALAKKGDLLNAETYLMESLGLCEQVGRKDLQVYPLMSLAMIREKENKISTAKEIYDRGMRLAAEFGQPREVIMVKRAAAELYKQGREYKIALQLFTEAKIIEDSIFNAEKAERIDELQTQYQTIEKEKEISLLEKDNELKTLQVKQERRNFFIGLVMAILFLVLIFYLLWQGNKLRKIKNKLEISIAEKDTLLKEIHHRVKNNLQLITSLLSIQAQGQSKQTIEEFLFNGQSRVKTIALIHERLYRADNLSSINFEVYAEELLAEIFRSYSLAEVDYKINAEKVMLEIEEAIPLGLILNELVNNALKHAFQDDAQGSVEIVLETKVDKVKLSVKDNGKGYELAPHKTDSMGLQLVKLLVQQLRGTLKIESDHGTLASVVFQQQSVLR